MQRMMQVSGSRHISFSLLLLLLTQFLYTNMGPIWAVVLSREYLAPMCIPLWVTLLVVFFLENIMLLLLTGCSLCCFLLFLYLCGVFCSFINTLSQRGSGFADGLSCVLQWVHCRVSWNQLCLAWGSPWPLPSAATPATTNCQNLAMWTKYNIISRFLCQNLSPTKAKRVSMYACACI